MFGREGEQIERRRRRTLSSRPTLAGFLAFLVILQGLAIFAPSVGHSGRAGEPSYVVSALGTTCVGDETSGGNAPTQERGHAQCCILCDARGSEKALPAIPQHSVLNALREPSFEIRRQSVAESPAARPVGWVTSWSPQAPPIFS